MRQQQAQQQQQAQTISQKKKQQTLRSELVPNGTPNVILLQSTASVFKFGERTKVQRGNGRQTPTAEQRAQLQLPQH